MKSKKIHKISLTAIFTALVFVATYFIAIPMPAGIGYINLGDAFILLSVWILGPIGCVCAGTGAMLADLLLGYAIYAPATLIIKSIMALACHYLFRIVSKITSKPIGFILSAISAELIMTLGYFIFEGVLYEFSSALLNVPFNLIQGLCAIIVSNIIINILFASRSASKYIDSIK